MNQLDYFILIPIAMGFVFGLYKGLIKELSSLLAIVFGIYGAKFLAPVVADILVKILHFSSKIALPMAYLILFIAIVVGLHFLARILNNIFDSLSLGGLNKVVGGFFGALKIALIISVLLNVFDAVDARFSILKTETKQKSICYHPIIKLGPSLWNVTSKQLK